VLADCEVWLMDGANGLDGVLILEPRADDLLIWSVAAAPGRQGLGLGNRLIAAADERAKALGYSTLRLYTGDKLIHNVTWYERHGYVRERIEDLGDRRLVHMVKHLP
jgi:GNAT superfamily N-acetyltransferase